MDKEKRQFIIWGAIILGVLVVWYFLIYNTNYQAIKKLETRKQELVGNLGRDIKSQEIQALQAQLDSLIVHKENQEKRLFPQSELIRLGDFLRITGQDAGLKLQEVSPDYSMLRNLLDPQQKMNRLSLKIEYQGSFQQFTAFWDRIDDFPYYFKVTEYFIDFAEAGKPDLRIRLNAEMFIIKKPSAQATETTSGPKPAVSS